jgi:phosphatidylserine/phosphatidylglycerophosphate/cardiolipin synthase-like enzyme
VALALRSTSAAVARARREQRVSTVWTGPTSPALPLRQTMGVLIQVVRAARERLLIVSFAAYKIPAVVAELHLAAEKGVAIVVVVDEATDAGKAFKTLGVDASLYRWPLAGTVAPGGAKVRMHVKAAVADDHTALVGSANLTGQALSQNMELGILVEGGEVPRQLDRHFRKLASSETLVLIGG